MAHKRVALVGATGRMGQALTRALAGHDTLVLAAAVTTAGHAGLGQDVTARLGLAPSGIVLSERLDAAVAESDVVVDFSAATAIPATLGACERAGRALVLGTTGYDARTAGLLDDAAARIPLLVAANTSLALNVLLALVRQAAAALPAGYDIEIVETHHRNKVDAPSGTALALGHAAAAGRNLPAGTGAGLTGSTPGPRPTGPIGYAVMRGGDVVGEHEVRFLGAGEQLHLRHIATDRAIFARGALAAAAWLAGRPAGRYSMSDVLSLNSST